MPPSLTSRLEAFGASPNGILRLDAEPTPQHLAYLDLMSHAPEETRPDAVVEFQHRPLLYVVDGMRPLPMLRETRRLLSWRDEQVFLAVSEPGRLLVYDVGLDGRDPTLIERFEAASNSAPTVVPGLALLPPEGRTGKAIRRALYEVLTKTTTKLAEQGVSAPNALSLTGRALFLRFLRDRRMLEGIEPAQVAPGARSFDECFETAGQAWASSRWLDETFNGDLLPLTHGSREWFSKLPPGVFEELSKIVAGLAPSGQRTFRFDWNEVNFAHVPIGVLSQVYEQYSHKVDPESARKESVHYTPHEVAQYIVDEAFAGLATPDAAHVLDPAAGAGVFLVAALRRLVLEQWRRTGERPRRPDIRRMLNEQIRGFDVSEAALRLAAFALYLTALELDPDPAPLEALRFGRLRGTVLYDLSDSGAAGLGSLGPVPKKHRGQYEIVMGNPPWTAATGKESKALVRAWSEEARPLVEARLGIEEARRFTFPDANPDLPFLWRAMEWAAPGARIALALPARILFNDNGVEARSQLFRALHVTGIMNGTALRPTPIWPRIKAPFCILVALNEPPPPGAAFYFVSPEEEPMTQRARFRVDAKAARLVDAGQAAAEPTLLKRLFRGTDLDRPVLRKLWAAPASSLREAMPGLAFRQGYQVYEGGDARDASALKGLPDLTDDAMAEGVFRVPPGLAKFSRDTLHRPRKPAIYRAPLVIWKKFPPERRGAARVLLSLEDCAYCESFFGLSTRGQPEAELLARYLFLLLNLNVPMYDALLNAPQFGVEREAFHVEDLAGMPVRPLNSLPAILRRQITELSDGFLGGRPDWERLDTWGASVYGLSANDVRSIADTLEVSLPYLGARLRAQQPPSREEQKVFAHELQRQLNALLSISGNAVAVRMHRSEIGEPWAFLTVSAQPEAEARGTEEDAGLLRLVAHEADATGASQLVVQSRPRELWVGLVAQYRYWTPSRASLLAMEILEEHRAALLPASGPQWVGERAP